MSYKYFEIKDGRKLSEMTADESMLAFVYENLCHAEITAFGHTFAR